MFIRRLWGDESTQFPVEQLIKDQSHDSNRV